MSRAISDIKKKMTFTKFKKYHKVAEKSQKFVYLKKKINYVGKYKKINIVAGWVESGCF